MEDSRENVAADIRAWLEWQKACGTDDWMVSNIAVWDSLLRVQPPQVPSQKNPPTQRIENIRPSVEFSHKKSETLDTKPTSVPAKKHIPIDSKQNNLHNLRPWWKSVIERRTERPQFNLQQIPQGQDGIQRAFAFRDANCRTEHCTWGIGRHDAPVVLLEGHTKPLAGAGLKMLSDMRANVLRLPKEKLYWIPMNRKMTCGHCDTMALAQLYAIQPKALLVFGLEPLRILRINDREAALQGKEIQVETNGRYIPAVCTIHPMQLVEEPRGKVLALQALRTFRFLLNKLNIERT